MAKGQTPTQLLSLSFLTRTEGENRMTKLVGLPLNIMELIDLKKINLNLLPLKIYLGSKK